MPFFCVFLGLACYFFLLTKVGGRGEHLMNCHLPLHPPMLKYYFVRLAELVSSVVGIAVAVEHFGLLLCILGFALFIF